MNCNASTLGSIKTPGEWDADVAVGDAPKPLEYRCASVVRT